MHLVCPACETAYEVPPIAVRPGRMVRCARCRHEWQPMQAEPEPDALPPPTPMLPPDLLAPVPIPHTSQQAAPPSRSSARAEVVAAWFLTVLLLAAGIAESLYWRAAIMKSWPPSERAYALLGYRQPAIQHQE